MYFAAFHGKAKPLGLERLTGSLGDLRIGLPEGRSGEAHRVGRRDDLLPVGNRREVVERSCFLEEGCTKVKAPGKENRSRKPFLFPLLLLLLKWLLRSNSTMDLKSNGFVMKPSMRLRARVALPRGAEHLDNRVLIRTVLSCALEGLKPHSIPS
ncbi:hypothetical protein GW17_00047853 [Ensete ventricosum]|nr:hypothetical protein GW17_00047853 [Ensete ventricosum]